ncbi:MAG: PilZ domain-containing protein, partial [Acidobacteriia bacterium]|nr:PilZ domain-containing protein [Terriglobia bacterium]
ECVGYRVEADGAVFVLATDTEPGSPTHDRSVRELAQGADVLVYDSQYTPEQLQNEKKGWGHSSWLEGTRIARECKVKKLVLFHYDPDHDDTVVDGLLEAARREIPDVTGAAEGLAINLPEGVVQSVRSAKGSDRRRHVRYQVELPVRVSWQRADGQKKGVQGFTRNISRSGIYFVAPAQLQSDGPLELDVILPDDITHRGDTSYRFVAQPLRRQRLNGTAGIPPPAVGVGALLTPVNSNTLPI